MRVDIIKIGNSRGVCIPQALLEQCNLGESAELLVENNSLIIRPLKKARNGWAKQFAAMHRQKDDKLLDEEIDNRFDDKEWEW